MHFRRLACALALLVIVLVAVWLFFSKPDRPPAAAEKTAAEASTAPASPGGATSPSSPVPVVSSNSSVANRTGAPATVTIPAQVSASPDAAAARAVDQVRLMFRDYRTLMGENPVGTNAEIMRALMGDNPRQATVGPPEGQTLNADGELVDRWGTPLFFHQLSKNVMEIRSAGPDKIMGTEDDIVTR